MTDNNIYYHIEFDLRKIQQDLKQIYYEIKTKAKQT